jgi:methylenetetrahydrofolate dehydrogenase (NADP+)/methenyltetrahydrofolate cyclohydrolase
MIINGKAIAEDILSSLEIERASFDASPTLGVLMSAGDAATESFIRIKSRAAARLGVEVTRTELAPSATTEEAMHALMGLLARTEGVIVQLPLPQGVDAERVLKTVPNSHDVDALGQMPHRVLAPVAGAVKEIIERHKVAVKDKKAIVIGAGRLVGQPCADLLYGLGAHVSVITTEQGSLSELKGADILMLGAGSPGMVKPGMLKPGVVLIDAGTSEAGGKLMGDAEPACAEIASLFTPVPGGVGPIAVAMIFKNLFSLARARGQ